MEILGLIDLPLWVILLVIICAIYYRYATRNFDVFKKMGVKGPKPVMTFGNSLPVLREGFIETYEEWFKKYGRVFGVFEGNYPLLILGDVELLKDVTVKEFSSFTNRRDFGVSEFAEPPFSEFLTALRDDDWKHNRNTLTPTFSGGKLKKMTEMILEAGQSFVDTLKPKADRGEPLEMKQHTGAYTMDVIAATAFGIKLNTQATPNDPFIKYARKFFDITIFNPAIIIMFFFPFLIPCMKWFKISLSPKDSMEFFSDIVRQALAERRQNPGKYKDFLQLMVNAEKEAHDATESVETNDTMNDTASSDDPYWKDKRKGKGLTDTEILAASILFFAAGYDTTASTLAYLFYHLAKNPDVMDRLIAEIDHHYPSGKSPDYETLSNLSYLEMVVREGLRINPPGGRMDRICGRDTVIGGIPIPKGMGVALPIYMIHHDPGYWPDPEVFDPERFTPEKREHHHPLQWIPFGSGPRNCIGMRLALLEMKLLIIKLFQNYRLVPNSKTVPLKFKDNPLLFSTKDGVWLTAEHRK